MLFKKSGGIRTVPWFVTDAPSPAQAELGSSFAVVGFGFGQLSALPNVGALCAGGGPLKLGGAGGGS